MGNDPALQTALYILGGFVIITVVIVVGFVALPIAAVALIGWGIHAFANRPPPKVPISDLYASALVQLKDIPDEQMFIDHFVDRVIRPYRDRVPPLLVSTEILNCISRLYFDERFTRAPAPPPLADEIAAARYRQEIIGLLQRARAFQTFADTVARSFDRFMEKFPDVARVRNADLVEQLDKPPSCLIPIADLISDKELIHDLISPFFSAEVRALGLFANLRSTLDNNFCNISGIPESKRKTIDAVIMPHEFKGSFREATEAYFLDTPFLDIFQSHVPFVLKDEIRFSGHWIIAPPGRGKTTLLHSMLMEDLKKDASIILMDSKGDLIEPIRNLKEISERCIIIDPDPQNPISINPLDVPKANIAHAVDLLEYVFGSLLDSKMTALQSTLFRSVLRALVTAFPNPTLETFRDILTNGYQPYIECIKKLSPDLQDFFYKEFNSKVYEDRKKEIIWRLRLLMENETIRSMLLALRTRFNIGDAMDQGKVIIINNSKARLGDQGSEFFGRFFIAQLLAAAQQRAGRKPENKKPCFFYIDECQNVIARDEKIPTILDECRSQKIALILAHQRTTQITSPNVLDALANCAVRYTNSDEEARTLAPKFRTTPETLQSLRRGQFAAFVRDMTPRAIVFDVSQVDFSKHPKLSGQEAETLRRKMREQYGVEAVAAVPNPPTPAAPARQMQPPPGSPEIDSTRAPPRARGPDKRKPDQSAKAAPASGRTTTKPPDAPPDSDGSPSW